MWLSEQITLKDWVDILKERPDVEKLYEKHIQNRKDFKTRM